MIVEFFISLFISVAIFLVQIAGVLPAMPEAIEQISYTIRDYAIVGGGLLTAILGPTLTTATFLVITAYMAYHLVWRVVVWAYRRIRG